MSDAADKYPLLERITKPADLRQLPASKLPALARELREFLIHTVSTRGGHFAAGLGTVELTIALHYIYNTPHDRLVWDVGHQAYPHKVLTGRRDRLHTIKQDGGLAPFPTRTESEYDTFGVGHSSTSISAALGMAVAAARAGEQRHVVAIIGDGAMTAGMAFEALNHAGSLPADLLVILNDNDMSISENVGALSNQFARALSGRVYAHLREGGKKVLRPMPAVWELARRSEEHLKGMVLPGTLFEEMGFNYIGPMDGHDVQALVRTLRNIRKLRGPQFLHVVTRKGKGYAPAEADPIKWHGPGPFDPVSGTIFKEKSTGPTYSQIFGQWLCDMAAADPRIIGITPAMREGSGLVEFSKRFPDRYFDVAIAEQHAVTFAAGLATQGYKPFVAIYSTFLQRAYDQVVHDVAIQCLPVRFMMDRAGLVGADGPTHAGSFDLAYLGCLPNFVLMAAADEAELVHMVATAVAIDDRPCAVRYPRGDGVGVTMPEAGVPLEIGKGRIIKQGNTVALLSLGTRLAECTKAAEMLAAQGISATVADARFAKPLDRDLILQLARNHELLITVEEGAVGGFGAQVMQMLSDAGALDRAGFKIRSMVLPDIFIDHDSPPAMYAKAGLDANGIVKKVFDVFGSRQAPELQPAEIAFLAERAQRRRNAKTMNGHAKGAAE